VITLLTASQRCACILAALLSLLGSTPAGASESPCFRLLSRAAHLASSGESLSEDALVRAVFTAWESLFEEAVVSAPDLQGWHGAGIESAKSWKYWLSPPEERLTSDLREGFEQLRGMVDSLLASVPAPRAIEAGLLDAFEQFASREEKRR